MFNEFKQSEQSTIFLHGPIQNLAMFGRTLPKPWMCSSKVSPWSICSSVCPIFLRMYCSLLSNTLTFSAPPKYPPLSFLISKCVGFENIVLIFILFFEILRFLGRLTIRVTCPVFATNNLAGKDFSPPPHAGGSAATAGSGLTQGWAVNIIYHRSSVPKPIKQLT